MINYDGLTRLVVILDDVVVKVARPDDGKIRKDNHGIRANLMEATLSPLHPTILCPVIWCSPDGSVLIMKKAESISVEEFSRLDVITFRKDLPIENKQSSFGKFNGQIVAIDYGG